MLETFKMPFSLHASLHVLSPSEILLRGGQGVTLLIIITEITQPFPKILIVYFGLLQCSQRLENSEEKVA